LPVSSSCCTFGGNSLYVCDFGKSDLGTSTKTSGRLLKVDIGVAGKTPYRGAIS
jgi:hypothetical protein